MEAAAEVTAAGDWAKKHVGAGGPAGPGSPHSDHLPGGEGNPTPPLTPPRNGEGRKPPPRVAEGLGGGVCDPHTDPLPLGEGEEMLDALLLEYVNSHSRFYSRAESKILQRAQEQRFQEREMGPLVERLERMHGPLDGARVLEIGSGSGGRSVAVALRGARVYGIEPSKAGVRASEIRARRYPGLQARFQVGIGEQIPFPRESFDLVFSTDVLQHVQVLPQVVAESYRVLRPGGRCYHEAPNNLYPWEFHYRMLWLPHTPKPLGKLYARVRGKDPRHLDDVGFLYRRSLISLMRRHGFVDLRDLYPEELARKARDVESIRSPMKRRAFGLLQRLGLAGLGLGVISTLGIYPQLRICGSKPSPREPSGEWFTPLPRGEGTRGAV